MREVRALYMDTNSTFRHQRLEDRLRRLVGGAALIRVGGTTDAETRERKLRIEDALFATRAAIEEGIVPGGGVALLRAADALAKPDKAPPGRGTAGGHGDSPPGVRGALPPDRRERRPRRSAILGRIRQRKGAHGYNAARDAFENLIEAGVVDPTMVVRLALQHAASIASLLLSSEALIADAPREPVDYPESGSAAGCDEGRPDPVGPRPGPGGRPLDLSPVRSALDGVAAPVAGVCRMRHTIRMSRMIAVRLREELWSRSTVSGNGRG